VANSNACHRWLSADPINVVRAKITTERIVRDAKSRLDWLQQELNEQVGH